METQGWGRRTSHGVKGNSGERMRSRSWWRERPERKALEGGAQVRSRIAGKNSPESEWSWEGCGGSVVGAEPAVQVPGESRPSDLSAECWVRWSVRHGSPDCSVLCRSTRPR